MASFLDIGVFSYFSVIFTFLLIFVVVFAFLEYMKIFGPDNKGWHAIIALAIAAIGIMSRGAMAFLGFVTPWFLVLFFVLFFLMFAYRMFGLGEKEMVGAVKEGWPWILVIAIIIILFGLGNSLGQSALDVRTGGSAATDTTAAADASSSTDVTAVDTGTGVGTADTGQDTSNSASTTTTTPTTGTGSGNFQQNLYNTFFHPKVLGMMFLLLIATVTIAFLAQRPN